MKKEFQVISIVELEYNENSTEFKEALASYKDVIYSKATARNKHLLLIITFYLQLNI